jgi:hypothetical protein
MYFGGRYHIIGHAFGAGNQFLWPGTYDVVQLPTGLTPTDFGEVEFAINFDVGVPGATLTSPMNGVQFVPEISMANLLALLIPGFAYICRHISRTT